MKKLVSSQYFFALLLLCCLCGASQQGLFAQELPPVGSQDQATPKVAPEQSTPKAAPEVVHPMEMRDSAATETLHIPVGHSLVLKGVGSLKRVYIGNPLVLQSFTAGPSEIVLTAKIPGVSDLVLWDTVGQSRIYTVEADLDSADLRRSLQEAYPSSKFSVEGREGRMYLSGTVATPEIADGMFKLASSHSKDIVNGLRVTLHGKQVQLKLRIVEIDRSKLEQYGVNLSAPYGTNLFNATTQQFPSTITASTPVVNPAGGTVQTVTASDMLNLFLYIGKANFGATVKALEQKQILQILAEPTLTAMSGQPAKFLSGGEFPFPIVQGGVAGSPQAISIQFRPYGVRLDFTPTVNEDGTIHLKIAPEVSSLDFSNAVTISGFVVPALSTKRAETEIEIRNGQSFALSGLLDHRTTENLSQIPGISRVPIIGKLFVAKSYSHSTVELMVMVTATIIDPLTETIKAVEPQMIVPNLDSESFDKDLSHEQKIAPKKP
jgi:pilus assembly protein CpaC